MYQPNDRSMCARLGGRLDRCQACGYYGWNGEECFDCGFRPVRRAAVVRISLVLLLAVLSLGCEGERPVVFRALCNGVERRVAADGYLIRGGDCAFFYRYGHPETTLCGCTAIEPVELPREQAEEAK